MDIAVVSGLVLVVLIAVLLLARVPIAVTIGLAAFLAIAVVIGLDSATFVAAQRLTAGMNSTTLLAIPLFILAGTIMNNGGIARRLIDAAEVMVGRMPGSLAQTNVVANGLFGSVSGAAVASAAAVGTVMSPRQKEQGYTPAFAAAVNVASAPAGMLIPPSNTLIIYSLVSGTSIAALFTAGYIPGLLWMLTCAVVVWLYTRRDPELKQSLKLSLPVAVATLARALPAIFMVVVVIGGILVGFFTPTESAAIAVVYSLLLSMIYRSVQVRDMPEILLTATKTTVIVLLLVGVSAVLSWAMAISGIPSALADLMLGLTDSPTVILLIIMVALLIIGTFLDPTPAILIFVPILLPIVTEFGVDPVHFGIMVTFNLSLGTITPPVGVTLFVGSKVGDTPIEPLVRRLLPFFAALVVTLLVIVFIPELSLWLPGVLGAE
ncbi:TRAP transporter large permease [Nesterenkonia rhizosphaerae]|uniref:TRAP transporter large permease n=1 Tax=Nesterenkonia rhizosphaerae TaxID=1348272 RepID=A0ABP9FPE6_9MICC